MEVIFAPFFWSHKNIATLFASMNVKFENVLTRFKSSKLYLNLDKTKWLLLHPVSQKGTYFHRPCLTFLLKIYISKGNM